MSSYWCDNPREHQREGKRDYERRGRYGYDSQQYNDHWNDCSKAYREGFDGARREDERRQEAYEEQRASEARQDRMAKQRRYEARREEEYYEQQYQDERYPPEPTTEEIIAYTLLPTLNWSRKRRIKWCRRNGLKYPA